MLVLIVAGIFSSAISSTIGGVVVLVVGAISAAWIAQRRKGAQDKKDEDLSITQKIENQGSMIIEMYCALVGDKATDLNPNPPPGLITTVPQLQKSVMKIENTLFQNGGKENTIVDRLDRLEKVGKGNQQIASRIEKQQTQNESERAERANSE